MRVELPSPQTIGAVALADRALWLIFSRPRQVLKLSWGYWLLYWACLVWLLWLLPRTEAYVPYYLTVLLWFRLCLPLWRAALTPLTLEFFGRPGYCATLSGWERLKTSFLGPWLTHTVSRLEGLGYQQASARAGELLKDLWHVPVVLFFVWLGFAWMLAELAHFAFMSCLPWLVGFLDIPIDTQQWLKPGVEALQWALTGTVGLGLEFCSGVLYRQLADYQEGGEFFDALDREYPP